MPYYINVKPNFQKKIMRHAKKQGMIHTQGNEQPKETIPKEAQRLDLLDEDFKFKYLKYVQRTK